jgi:DNA primase
VAPLDQTFKDEVRARNDIVEVIASYLRLERRGNRYWGLCPFHSEKTPSFTVLPDQQIYHCFGCKATGDVFRFVQEREHLSFYEALVHLAKRAQIPLPREERTPEEEKAYQERRRLYEALEMGARFFQHCLTETEDGKAALAYLQGRGLTDETIRRFRLGWAPGYSKCFRSLAPRFGAEALLKAGLIKPRREGSGYMDAFFGRVIFPITDLNGRVIGYGGRILEGTAAKYINSAETNLFSKRLVLFGLAQAKEEIRRLNQAILVEGYMDVITPHQAGIRNVVAPLGTALTDEQCQLLRRQAEQVVVAFDADTAGQMATLRGLDRLYDAGCDVRVLRIPDGKDPDGYMSASGADAFRQLVAGAVPLVEFKLRLAMERAGGQSPESKLAAVKAVARVLAGVKSELIREEYLRRVAEELAGGTLSTEEAQEALRRNLNRLLREGFQNNQAVSWNNIRGSGLTRNEAEVAAAVESPVPASETGVNKNDPVWVAERMLLRLLVQHPGLWVRVADELGPQPFEDSLHREIAANVETVLKVADPHAGSIAARLLDVVNDGAARRLVAEFAAEPLVSARPQEEAAGCMNTIKRHRVQRRIDELARIMEAQQAEGKSVEPSVIREFTELSVRVKKS